MIIGAWRGQIWMWKEKTDEALKFFLKKDHIGHVILKPCEIKLIIYYQIIFLKNNAQSNIWFIFHLF